MLQIELQAKIDADDKAAQRLRERIVEQMQRYKAAYPAETAEMDARYKSPDGDPRLWKADNAAGMSPDRQVSVPGGPGPTARPGDTTR